MVASGQSADRGGHWSPSARGTLLGIRARTRHQVRTRADRPTVAQHSASASPQLAAEQYAQGDNGAAPVHEKRLPMSASALWEGRLLAISAISHAGPGALGQRTSDDLVALQVTEIAARVHHGCQMRRIRHADLSGASDGAINQVTRAVELGNRNAVGAELDRARCGVGGACRCNRDDASGNEQAPKRTHSGHGRSPSFRRYRPSGEVSDGLGSGWSRSGMRSGDDLHHVLPRGYQARSGFFLQGSCGRGS